MQCSYHTCFVECEEHAVDHTHVTLVTQSPVFVLPSLVTPQYPSITTPSQPALGVIGNIAFPLRTNERPGTVHVTSGLMKDLEKNTPNGKQIQIDKRTRRLYD